MSDAAKRLRDRAKGTRARLGVVALTPDDADEIAALIEAADENAFHHRGSSCPLCSNLAQALAAVERKLGQP